MRFLRSAPLVVFALVVVSGCIQSEKTTAPDPSVQIEELQNANQRLRAQLEEARARNESARRGETVEILSTDVYFKSGSADLTPEGVEKLRGVVARIQRQYAGRIIRVEGHTDATPIGDKLKDKWPSNWELSAARSAAVVRHLQWTHNLDPERLEVVGYGPYQPVATNDTAEGRRKNRRVRIAVLPEPVTETAGRTPTSGDSDR